MYYLVLVIFQATSWTSLIAAARRITSYSYLPRNPAKSHDGNLLTLRSREHGNAAFSFQEKLSRTADPWVDLEQQKWAELGLSEKQAEKPNRNLEEVGHACF